jgi:hypothetical protein
MAQKGYKALSITPIFFPSKSLLWLPLDDAFASNHVLQGCKDNRVKG